MGDVRRCRRIALSPLGLQGFRNAEQEANGLRERVEDLEQRLTDDQRALLTTRTQSETQRKESSQLLQTVFQNLNKILGTEVSPEGGEASCRAQD